MVILGLAFFNDLYISFKYLFFMTNVVFLKRVMMMIIIKILYLSTIAKKGDFCHLVGKNKEIFAKNWIS